MAVPKESTGRKPLSAVERLELSQISPLALQRELLGTDLDIYQTKLLINRAMGMDVGERITGANINRSIESSSILTITLDDTDRAVLRSGQLGFDPTIRQTGKSVRTQHASLVLHNALDIKLDGLWFRLNGVEKQGDELTLTFIDREIAILKKYDKHLIASRTKVTRAQFILRMIREVTEFKIPVVIPELEIVQPVEKTASSLSWESVDVNRGMGIPKKNDLTVKRHAMTESQRRVAETILDVASNPKPPFRKMPRKLMVVSIMVAIQESGLANLDYGKPGDYNYISSDNEYNPRGAFQQIAHWGWASSGDVATDAQDFFAHAIDKYNGNPNEDYGTLALRIQNPGGGPEQYGQWRTEAERIVSNYGVVPDNSASANAQATPWGTGGDYHYFRGIPPLQGEKQWKPENSWDCIQRLADEVGFRAFFVSGTFYYISEDRLLRSRPLMTIDEDTPGVHSIDGAYLQYSKAAEIQIPCDIGRWTAPPGSIVQIVNSGPFNGRWITSQCERDLFDTEGLITVKKSDPVLPEPGQDQLSLESGAVNWNNLRTTSNVNKTDSGEPIGPVPGNTLNLVTAAAEILRFKAAGQYRDDNGLQTGQLQKLSNGQKLHSRCGFDVDFHPAVLNTLVSLMQYGFYIGTYALCEDHDCLTDGGNRSQHAVGQAVDISSVGVKIQSQAAAAAGVDRDTGLMAIGHDLSETNTRVVKAVMRYLQKTPWVHQIICNGNGTTMADVEALQWNGNGPQGGWWVDDHLDHIHYGVAPGGS